MMLTTAKAPGLVVRVVPILVAFPLLLVAMAACSSPSPTPRAPVYPSPVPTPTAVPAPRIAGPEGTFDVGDVPQDTPLRGSFDLGNAGRAPLQIARVHASPPVSVVGQAPITLQQGETTTVDFTMDTSEPGLVSGGVQVYSNDPSTPVRTVPISVSIVPVPIYAEERTERYLEMVPVEKPSHLLVEDLGRKEAITMDWPTLIGHREEWTLKLSNLGPGRVAGKLAIRTKSFLSDIEQSQDFALEAGATSLIAFMLDNGFILAKFVPREYAQNVEQVQEEIEKQRGLIDIVSTMQDRKVVLDTFPKESPKVSTWKRSDYYHPSPVCMRLQLGSRSPVSCAESPAPSSVMASPSPVDFALDVHASGIQQSGLFGQVVSTQTTAKITNSGDLDAHDVTVLVTGSTASGKPLSINGSQQVEVPVGVIPAHQTVQKEIPLEIDFDVSTGNEAKASGIRFTISVRSREKTRDFPYDCTLQGCS